MRENSDQNNSECGHFSCSAFTCENGKYSESINGNLVNKCDKFIEAKKTVPTKTISAKTASTKTVSTSFYILFTLLLVNIS